MLDLGGIDVEEIATALADQTDYEHRWLLDPRTGQVAFWTSDTGIDGETPVEIDELDLIPIDPIPSCVWYRDMADFAEGISDGAAGRRLASALQGRGAFRRFENQLHEYLRQLPPWHALRDVRAQRRAVDWLLDQGLISDDAAEKFAAGHPEPGLPWKTARVTTDGSSDQSVTSPGSARLCPVPLPPVGEPVFPDLLMGAPAAQPRNTVSSWKLASGWRCGLSSSGLA